MCAMKKHWLMKSEPDAFSIDDLERVGTEPGVACATTRRAIFLRAMSPGDKVLFYHSSTAVPGVVGIAEVATEPYPDPTQFERKSPYFDPKSSREEPRWSLVDVRFKRKLKRVHRAGRTEGERRRARRLRPARPRQSPVGVAGDGGAVENHPLLE
jgi:predicted RNA-binding protein with PUA-like domain